jgi:hypothetical protein
MRGVGIVPPYTPKFPQPTLSTRMNTMLGEVFTLPSFVTRAPDPFGNIAPSSPRASGYPQSAVSTNLHRHELPPIGGSLSSGQQRHHQYEPGLVHWTSSTSCASGRLSHVRPRRRATTTICASFRREMAVSEARPGVTASSGPVSRSRSFSKLGAHSSVDVFVIPFPLFCAPHAGQNHPIRNAWCAFAYHERPEIRPYLQIK